MIDVNFPKITYTGNSPFDWGVSHGEQFKDAIKELSSIRRELMLKKSPHLKSKLDELAKEQFELTKKFAPEVTLELEGIAKGAELSITDIVILNNYTDFRDIELPEEGCTTIHIQSESEQVSGQTWDMHQSAKNYVCVIEIPRTDNSPKMAVFSLVGCVGMMGVTEYGQFIGVNNINTLNAKVGVIWPVLVRKCLKAKGFNEMKKTLVNAPVTSGHNYLISDLVQSEQHEITPEKAQMLFRTDQENYGVTFHTNHCLGNEITPLEDKKSISSTTHARYNIVQSRLSELTNYESMKSMLKDHEGHPKSICSHYESGAQDPSMTCGAGIYDHMTKKALFWRGCEEFDSNYREIMIQF